MQDTKRFRKKFTDDVSYNIAIFYGSLMQISLKLETLYSTMKKLSERAHFLWYLVLYEKILAANVDVHNMVERIFYLHDIYVRRSKGERVCTSFINYRKHNNGMTQSPNGATLSRFCQPFGYVRNTRTVQA